MGGQSSYNGIDDYISTTNRKSTSGNGLADKVGEKLQNLKIGKPKRKNISLSL
jgi:hypothetical protein